MRGTLYVVSTPIGNMEDITYRAARVLASVGLIACEDTRRTGRLLKHLDIRKPLLSYHDHNESGRSTELIARLEGGADVALVSDAGTPLISDPGFEIVRQAAEAGITVTPVPGASAALTALAASGLPADSFLFIGFLPLKGARRKEMLERIRTSPSTVILYEAPHRVLRTLDDLAAALGERQMVAARELTKLHEESLRGSAAQIHAELAGRVSIKGEFTLVIDKSEEDRAWVPNRQEVRQEVERLIEEGTPRMDAIKAVAKRSGLPKRRVYEILESESS